MLILYCGINFNFSNELILCVNLAIVPRYLGFPGDTSIKNLPAKTGDIRDGFDPWVGKIPWRRKWRLTPVFLPGESHGQGNLSGYNL